ncbi:MAG: ABC transporter substrate-binding protein [Dehalococcoidales bacterium]|nr:ABC transporter substrate-binding protein [Dehalococcoidales bacterium]MDD4230491.1 ABC transporter substrate-binding protein [Dehalococcoidales bacterium]MDD4465234.1 ABC transporter substrate-binding protein [Dehalococcoidales bacterium]MDD5402843.1 ABC transporter substrate-binding protein [Dehalococcoidales bacterium]
MKRNRLKMVLVCILFLLPLVVTGCKSGAGMKETVKIVMGDYFAHYVLTYAIENGFVDSGIIDLDITYAADFAHNTELLGGNAPVGEMSISAFAKASEQTRPSFKAVAVFVNHEGMEQSRGVSGVFVAENSDISTPLDLVGKKIGVTNLTNNTTTVFLGLCKDLYQITEEQFSFVVKPPVMLRELLAKGEVDAIILGGDPSIELFYDDNVELVYNIDIAFKEEYGFFPFPGVWVVESGFYSEHGDIAGEIQDLMLRSLEYGEEHLEELSELYAQEYGGSADFYVTVYRNHYRIVMAPIGNESMNAIMTMFRFAKDRGLIGEIPGQDMFVLK